MRVLVVSSTVSGNALGRSYVLWVLAKHLGWSATVAGPTTGELWRPAVGTAFASDVVAFERRRWLVDPPLALARDVDVVIAAKLLPESFGVARRMSRAAGRPLLLDVDDADDEMRRRSFGWRRRLGLVWPTSLARRAHPLNLTAARIAARRTPVMVGNPSLQQRFDGPVVPHVRPVRPAGSPHEATSPVVAFVGTVRPHKGIEQLRSAVRLVRSDADVRLVVTADRPADAAPWEDWVGETTMEDGLRLVDTADVVVVPSLPQGYALAQVPVKLVDAMMSGRAIVASDLPPIRWALGGSGILVPPADRVALAEALQRTRDPSLRARLGAAARRRALEAFVPDVVAPVFARAVRAAVRGG